jgi:hypothetical protein
MSSSIQRVARPLEEWPQSLRPGLLPVAIRTSGAPHPYGLYGGAGPAARSLYSKVPPQTPEGSANFSRYSALFSFTHTGVRFAKRLPNQRLKLTARGGRLMGNGSVLSAAAAGRSLSAIR